MNEPKKSDFISSSKILDFWLSEAEILKNSSDLIYSNIRKANSKLEKLFALNQNPRGKKRKTFLRLFSVRRNFQVCLMLWAYSIENLIKGIYIDQNGIDEIEGKIHKKIIKHDLLELLKEVKLDGKFNKMDGKFLNILSEMSVWAGRYPVPTRFENIKVFGYNFERDSMAFNKIFQVLKNEVAIRIGRAASMRRA